MTALSLLGTALLLGLYVLLAGGYGLAYSIARLHPGTRRRRIAAMCYGLHALAALVLCAATPLGLGWKGLIAASSVVFLGIPPITWRYLQRAHEAGT